MTKRRNKQQGAVLVESLVVSSLLIIAFGATWFFHQLHDQKGDTMREARYRAWAATHFTCEGGSVNGQGTATVQVPHTMQMRGTGQQTRSVQSAVNMPCNVQPRADDTPLAAIGSIGDLIGF